MPMSCGSGRLLWSRSGAAAAVVVFALGLLLGSPPAGADAPLPPPATHEVRSPNGAYVAVADVTTDRIAVYRSADRGGAPLWSFPGWQRYLWLADDGHHLVIGYPGANLLRLDQAEPATVMLRFVRDGVVFRERRLGELVADLRHLRRTVSHYFWGYVVGWDALGRLIVETVEQHRFAFDPATGDAIVLAEQ